MDRVWLFENPDHIGNTASINHTLYVVRFRILATGLVDAKDCLICTIFVFILGCGGHGLGTVR